jgi:hypothetical protein
MLSVAQRGQPAGSILRHMPREPRGRGNVSIKLYHEYPVKMVGQVTGETSHFGIRVASEISYRSKRG